MSLTFTKKQVEQVMDVMEAEHESFELAARAVLAKAVELIEQRAKFMVIGRLSYPGPGREMPDDEWGNRMVLGWYSTAGDAEKAGRSLAYNNATHEQFQWWMAPVFHGTAAAYYKERKLAREAEAKADMSYFHRRLQERLDYLAEHPDARDTDPDWPDFMRGVIPMDDPEAIAERDARAAA